MLLKQPLPAGDVYLTVIILKNCIFIDMPPFYLVECMFYNFCDGKILADPQASIKIKDKK